MIILDLDNCIADDEWRIPRIKQDVAVHLAGRYLDYHLLAPFDRLRNREIFFGVPDVVIFTARPEMFRVSTEEWLRRNGVRHERLVMRPLGNTLGSVSLKRNMLHAQLQLRGLDPVDIICAYDDRPDVIAMYREEGVGTELVKIHDISYGG